MDSSTVITILLGLIALGIPAAAFLVSTKANRVQAEAEIVKAETEARGVDAQAFDRAAGLYGGMFDRLQAEIARISENATALEAEVASLRAEKAHLAEEVASLRATNASLTSEVSYLRAEIAVLRKSHEEG